MKLLHVDSSILGAHSVSRELSQSIVDHWRRAQPAIEVIRRDLIAADMPHLTGATFAAMQAGADVQPSDDVAADLRLGAALVDEFLAADVVVVGAPMYNFAISSQLKAWIDRLAVAGKTFAYSETGVVGLAGGKTVIIASSRGGIFSDGAMAGWDHQESYLRQIFGFFGIEDIRIIRAEGLAISPESRSGAMESAQQALSRLAA